MSEQQMFSEMYIKHLEDLAKAERVHKVAPNPHTEKVFKELSNKTFTYKQRFTPEYIREYQKSKKDSQIKASNEMRHVMNALHIEDLFDSHKIDENRRMYLHNKNDNKFNLNYFSYGNDY